MSDNPTAPNDIPRLWGLPVISTPSIAVGKFVVLDAMRAGYIADREDAVVRISENVNDHFVRNLAHSGEAGP